MAVLRPWQELPAGGAIPAEDAPHSHWRLADWPETAVELDACVNCLLCWLYCPDAAIRVDGETFVGIDYEFCKGCEICAEICPAGAIDMVSEESDVGRTEAALELLTGGEAVAHAMRQIDPTSCRCTQSPRPRSSRPSRSSCPTAAPRASCRRRVGAFGDERRDRLSPRRRADDDRDELPGSRADGGGRLHRRLYARPGRRRARESRAVRPDQHPLRPLGLDADPRLGSDPALRRERAGGVRRDAARDAAGRAHDVLLPVFVRLDGFTITHSADLWRSSATSRSARFVGSYDVPHPLLDTREPTTHDRSRCRTTTSSCAGARPPRFTPRLEWSAALRRASGLTGRRYEPLERYRLDDAARALVLMGSSAGTAKDVVDELRGLGQPVGLLRIGAFRPFPADAVREALHTLPASRSSIAPTRRAAPHRSTQESPQRFTAGGRGYGASHWLGAGIFHREEIEAVFESLRPTGARDCLRRTARQPMSRLKTIARRQAETPALGSGHSLCQGCGVPMVVRTILGSIETPGVALRTGCLEVATTRYPGTPPGTCPGSTSRSRTPRRSQGRRDGVPRPATPWTDPRRAGHLRRNRRRRRHLRHRAAGAFRRPGAWPSVSWRLRRQRGVHEHQVQRSAQLLRCGHDNQPGRPRELRQGAAAQGYDRHRRRPPRSVRGPGPVALTGST